MQRLRNNMKTCRTLIGAASVSYAVIVVCILSSCKDTSNSVSSLGDIVFPATNISYEKLVQPLFNIGCATTSCHDSQNTKLNLTFYGSWVQDPGVIVAKDTSDSRLVWCIEARPGSPPMPPAKALSENQIRGLTQWVLEGAKDTQ
jgi:hypothetical protein